MKIEPRYILELGFGKSFNLCTFKEKLKTLWHILFSLVDLLHPIFDKKQALWILLGCFLVFGQVRSSVLLKSKDFQ